MKATFGVALVLVMSISKFAIAQDEEQTELEEDNRPIEQIDVVGERSLVSMRYQIRVAEDTLYNLFNDLITVEKYRIRCRREIRTGTHLTTRSCEPRFFRDFRQFSNSFALGEMRDAFTDTGFDSALFQRGLDFLEPESELRAQLAADYEGLQQEMFRLATENEDYREQLLRVGQLKAEYETAWQQRFGNNEEESDEEDN